MYASAELNGDVMVESDRHAHPTAADRADLVPDQSHVGLSADALKVGRPEDAAAVEDVIAELGSAVPFVLLVDLLGSRVAARFGHLALVALGRAHILSPGLLTDASVISRPLPLCPGATMGGEGGVR